jgi:hypothetical protein
VRHTVPEALREVRFACDRGIKVAGGTQRELAGVNSVLTRSFNLRKQKSHESTVSTIPGGGCTDGTRRCRIHAGVNHVKGFIKRINLLVKHRQFALEHRQLLLSKLDLTAEHGTLVEKPLYYRGRNRTLRDGLGHFSGS